MVVASCMSVVAQDRRPRRPASPETRASRLAFSRDLIGRQNTRLTLSGERIRVDFAAAAVTSDDYDRFESLGDGDVATFTRGAVIKLRTAIALAFGDVIIATDNVAPDYPGCLRRLAAKERRRVGTRAHQRTGRLGHSVRPGGRSRGHSAFIRRDRRPNREVPGGADRLRRNRWPAGSPLGTTSLVCTVFRSVGSKQEQGVVVGHDDEVVGRRDRAGGAGRIVGCDHYCPGGVGGIHDVDTG